MRQSLYACWNELFLRWLWSPRIESVLLYKNVSRKEMILVLNDSKLTVEDSYQTPRGKQTIKIYKCIYLKTLQTNKEAFFRLHYEIFIVKQCICNSDTKKCRDIFLSDLAKYRSIENTWKFNDPQIYNHTHRWQKIVKKMQVRTFKT